MGKTFYYPLIVSELNEVHFQLFKAMIACSKFKFQNGRPFNATTADDEAWRIANLVGCEAYAERVPDCPDELGSLIEDIHSKAKQEFYKLGL